MPLIPSTLRVGSLPSLPADVRFCPVVGVVSVSQDDTTVLLDSNAGVYYTLNEVGGRIWASLVSGGSLSDTIHVLRQEYDVMPEVLATDTTELVRALIASRLVAPVKP